MTDTQTTEPKVSRHWHPEVEKTANPSVSILWAVEDLTPGQAAIRSSERRPLGNARQNEWGLWISEPSNYHAARYYSNPLPVAFDRMLAMRLAF